MRIIVEPPRIEGRPHQKHQSYPPVQPKVFEPEESAESYIRFIQGANAFIAVNYIQNPLYNIILAIPTLRNSKDKLLTFRI